MIRQSIPAKSGHEDSSNENDTNESKGIPALLDGHCGTTTDFDLKGRLAPSTSNKDARHQRKRERVLRNMLIALTLSIRYDHPKVIYRIHRQRKQQPKHKKASDRAWCHGLSHELRTLPGKICGSCGRWLGVDAGRRWGCRCSCPIYP